MIDEIYQRFRYPRSIDYSKSLTPPLDAAETGSLKQQFARGVSTDNHQRARKLTRTPGCRDCPVGELEPVALHLSLDELIKARGQLVVPITLSREILKSKPVSTVSQAPPTVSPSLVSSNPS